MKIKKTIQTLLLSAVFSVPALSSQAASNVKVEDASGKAVFFALSDHPTVTFTSESLVIKGGDQTVEYPLADYRRFTFSDETLGIGSTEMAGTPVFSFGDELRGHGLKLGELVSVYTSAGQLVGQAKADAGGSVTVPLNGQHGIFIVKSQSQTFKFIKK